MSKEFVADDTCSFKVGIYLNKDGNICQNNESPVSQKNVTFSGFTSSLTASEAINDTNSPALHNGVSGLMWLFTGQDSNFNPNIKRTLIEEVEDV